MSQPRVPGLNPLPFILAGIAGLFGVLLIGVAVYSLIGGNTEVAEATNTPGPPRIVSLPSSTPVAATATSTSTATLMPTATELVPTSSPTELPTATSVPPTDRLVVTNPPPPPTNTPVPPTVPAGDTRLTNVSFSVESTTVPANTKIWFNFSVTNASLTQPLSIGELGVVVFNSAGQNVFFQESWSGFELQPGQTLNHRDGVPAIGTPGSYTLQLSVCFSSKSVCSSGGEWVLLAQPVAITVQ